VKRKERNTKESFLSSKIMVLCSALHNVGLVIFCRLGEPNRRNTFKGNPVQYTSIHYELNNKHKIITFSTTPTKPEIAEATERYYLRQSSRDKLHFFLHAYMICAHFLLKYVLCNTIKCTKLKFNYICHYSQFWVKLSLLISQLHFWWGTV